MKNLTLMPVAVLLFIPSLSAQQPERFSLVARLGVDTIAVENIVRSPTSILADVVIRSPRTILLRHELTLNVDGTLARLETSQVDPSSGVASNRVVYTRVGDSVRVASGEGGATVRMIAAPATALPFIDLVHWPFDHLLRRLRSSGAGTVGAPMLSGSRVQSFPLAMIGRDSATVTHPSRGTMRLTVGPAGELVTLDAGATTRALVVTRGTAGDVATLAREFAARDAAGRGVGELSGRGESETTVHGAEIALDWGRPVKRGRDIWGALVRYGQVWRTGANTATHFTTSAPLRFGDLTVPAGRYTLYSIPEATGGLLIINRQTGQNGQQYDPAQDLGRIPLRVRSLAEPVEVFTIRADPEGDRGVLRLQWDRTELVADFQVVR